MTLNPDLESTDECLREWGYYFRDRKHLEQCRSVEHLFRATSDDFSTEGWGDMDSAPRTQPARSYSILRALQTHEVVQSLDRIYKWALTYGFAYPSLPRFVVLRCMRKYTGRRFNWTGYVETLDIARFRVHTAISGVFSKKSLTA